MKLLQLFNGGHAKVDDADFDTLNGYEWKSVPASGKSTVTYAVTRIGIGKLAKTRTLHRMITGFPDALIDHIDGDGLNCQRENLRKATRSQNAANAKHHADSKSRFKGVSFDKATGKYRTQIMVNGKIHRLGRFATDVEAAIAYDEAARLHFGEFARVNFPMLTRSELAGVTA